MFTFNYVFMQKICDLNIDTSLKRIYDYIIVVYIPPAFSSRYFESLHHIQKVLKAIKAQNLHISALGGVYKPRGLDYGQF